MRIKQLINSEQELIDYAWRFISWKIEDKQVWKDEDLPILQPFFERQAKGGDYKFTEEEGRGFDRWQLARKEYADEEFEIRDACQQIDIGNLCDAFFLKQLDMECWDYNDNGDEIDEQGNIVPPLSKNSLEIDEDWKKELTFPLVMVGSISSDFDRMGPVAILSIDFVELKDFTPQQTKQKQT
jgi:hypothetical protein